MREAFLQAALWGFEKRNSFQEKPAGSVYVAGPFTSLSGIGQGARLYWQNLGGNAQAIDVTRAMAMPCETTFEKALRLENLSDCPAGGSVVIHANPPQFQLVLRALGKKFLADKKIIAYWAWEYENFPTLWQKAAAYVDAVEAPSSFVAEALKKITAKPVFFRPHPVKRPLKVKKAYAQDGIVRCLFIFDAGSGFERKNPMAAVKAFQKAFAKGEAKLELRCRNAHLNPKGMAALTKICGPDVTVKTKALDRDELANLYQANDIYLSLHRSEGFGLTIAEAMLAGLHVVATGWSGNMDFMRGERAHPVKYRFATVSFHSGAAKGLKTRWAEADTEDAATILQSLRNEWLNNDPAKRA